MLPVYNNYKLSHFTARHCGITVHVIEDITGPLGDTKLPFSCWKIFHEWAQQMSEKFFNTRREISYLQATNNFLFIIHEILKIHSNIFGDFLKIFDHFLRIQRLSKRCPKARQMFPNIFRRLPKIQYLKIAKTSKKDLKMVWLYINKFNKCSLGGKNVSMIMISPVHKNDILRCRISLPLICYHFYTTQLSQSINRLILDISCICLL